MRRKTLSAVGAHKMTVVRSGVEKTTNFTVTASHEILISPQTGDDPIEFWIILMVVCAAGAIALFVLGRRRRVFGK